MSAATMNEMDRLRRERDEARAECDALTAHVGRLREGHERAFSTLRWSWMRDLLDETPTTSLARLKAEWCEQHAKRFMELADNARTNGYAAHADGVDEMAQELKDEAAELRRQAEESANGHH